MHAWSAVHKGWLAVLVVIQLVFLLSMPIFTGNDERGHMYRMWALTEGHFFCQDLPKAVRDVDAMQVRRAKFGDYWKRGVALRGSSERIDGWSYACYYFPLGLALPALATRIVALDWHGAPRAGGVFLSTYAARLISVALVDLALIFFLSSAPWGRSTVLAFFSNPMMIEQSVSFGHDYLLFGLCLTILALAFTRSDWRAVGWISLLATLMTLIKPVFLLFGLCGLPMIARLTPSWKALHWKQRLLALSWLAPLPVYRLWYQLGDVPHRMWMPRFVHPEYQISFLKHHPLHFFTVMIGYLHYFIDDHKLVDFTPHRINGEWTTLFFANLWLEMPKLGCVAAALGIVLAMVADATSAPHPLPEPSSTRLRAAKCLAAAGVAAAIPATILALYITYTPVGADGPYAVQGRYHACALLALALLGVHALKRTRPIVWRASLAVGLTAAALMLVADRYALVTIWRYYWM